MFRFEAFWVKEKDCKDVIRRGWESCGEGSPLERWNSKITACRNLLASWSKNKFKKRDWKIQEMMKHLNLL